MIVLVAEQITGFCQVVKQKIRLAALMSKLSIDGRGRFSPDLAVVSIKGGGRSIDPQ